MVCLSWVVRFGDACIAIMLVYVLGLYRTHPCRTHAETEVLQMADVLSEGPRRCTLLYLDKGVDLFSYSQILSSSVTHQK
jgi:hypothetical protein